MSTEMRCFKCSGKRTITYHDTVCVCHVCGGSGTIGLDDSDDESATAGAEPPAVHVPVDDRVRPHALEFTMSNETPKVDPETPKPNYECKLANTGQSSPRPVLTIDLPPSNPVTPRFASGPQPINECPSCNGDGVVTSEDDEEDGVVDRAGPSWSFPVPDPTFAASLPNWFTDNSVVCPPSAAAMAARPVVSNSDGNKRYGTPRPNGQAPAPSAPVAKFDPAHFDGDNVYWNRGPSPAAPSHNPEVDVLSGQELFEKYGGGAWKIPANDPRRRRYLNIPPSPTPATPTPPVTPPASSRQRARDSLLVKLKMAESLLNTPRRTDEPPVAVDQIQALTARITLLEATVAMLVETKAAVPSARESVRLELLRKVIDSMDFKDL